jgi:hypothetical protein
MSIDADLIFWRIGIFGAAGLSLHTCPEDVHDNTNRNRAKVPIRTTGK